MTPTHATQGGDDKSEILSCSKEYIVHLKGVSVTRYNEYKTKFPSIKSVRSHTCGPLSKDRAPATRLVGRRIRVLRLRKANTAVGGVVHGVEALQEREAVNEVQPLPALAPHVGGDEVDLVVVAAEKAVELARPDLRVGGELEGGLGLALVEE